MDLMEDGTETMLWADKYCPREYMQLLSDDVRRERERDRREGGESKKGGEEERVEEREGGRDMGKI